MRHFSTIPRRSLLLWGAALAALGPVAGRAADWQNLTGNSPFGQSAPVAAAPAAGEMEFRGVVQEGDVYFINIYNPTTKASQWIPVKGKEAGLEVKAYDARTDKVEI